jgi:1,2-diacylglycerol 3-alpha-glucosyltransferase
MANHHQLKIAYVLDTYDGAKNGGVLSAQRFVEALRERHQVTVVATGESGPDRVSLPAFHVPFFKQVMQKMGFVFAAPRTHVLKKIIAEADVVHVQFPFWLGARAALLAQRLAKPVVAGFHVQPENMFLNIGLSWQPLIDWSYRLFVRWVYDRADTVVCPSEFARRLLLAHGLKTRAVVISNGTAPQFSPAALPRAERHRDKILVLVVGRLAREKRVDVIIEAVRRSRFAERIALVITGKGPERERLLSLGATLPIPAEVAFVDDSELLRLYNTADLMVHASLVELEGMAVLEALACGTPTLIANAHASAARQFAVSPDFLFAPNDPTDLARHMDALLSDPPRLAAARQASLAVASEYSFATSVQKLEHLYHEVLERRAIHSDAGSAVKSAIIARQKAVAETMPN